MKSRKVMIFIGILIALTVITTILHLSTREEVPEHSVKVTTSEKEITLDIMSMEHESVTGIRINGKGEEIPVEGEGIKVQQLLESLDIREYSKVRIVSDDSYEAQVTKEEVMEKHKVYFLLEEDTLRLVVFGDTNSKRSVSHVVQIIVE